MYICISCQRNRPYSYFLCQTGTRLELRGVISNVNNISLFLMMSHCKLIPVHHREYEYGLFTTGLHPFDYKMASSIVSADSPFANYHSCFRSELSNVYITYNNLVYLVYQVLSMHIFMNYAPFTFLMCSYPWRAVPIHKSLNQRDKLRFYKK